jgi:hypothetical protein
MPYQHYWAVRPKSMPEHIRIEKAATAMHAYELAFGRGNPWGAYEVKDLGTRVAVIQSDTKRMALLTSPEGWITLGKPFSTERRKSNG